MAASSGIVPLTDDDQRHTSSADRDLSRPLAAYLTSIALVAMVPLAVAAAGTPDSTLRRASLIHWP